MAARLPTRPSGPPPALRGYERKPRRKPDQVELDRALWRQPWRRLRKAFIHANPLCAACQREGRTVAAEHVHHVVDRRDRPELTLDWDSLEALCASCHNAETARRSARRPGGDR